jgi:hypothetical protein
MEVLSTPGEIKHIALCLECGFARPHDDDKDRGAGQPPPSRTDGSSGMEA